MMITRVTYERLHSFGNYENETIGCEITLEDGESPELALDRARSWVTEQLNQRQERTKAIQDTQNAEWRLENIKRQVAHAETQFARMDAFLKQFGIEIRERFDDVPF